MPTIEQARQWYADSNAVHDFDHVLRVYHMAETLAEKEGADIEIVRAAALLHDAEGASGESDARLAHHEAAASFAGKVLAEEGWETERIQAVQHCILTHRFRDERSPNTIEAQVLFDADKLDAIGAIGAARALAYAVLDGQPIYAEPSSTFQKELKTEPGEPYTAYHEHLFKLSRIKDRMLTKSGKTMAAARHDYLEGFFEQLKAEVTGQR